MGHRGVATSFFSERDEPLASVLTRTLLETNQEIPEFLQQYVPEGEARDNLKFEADSDFDPNDFAGAGDAGGAWGAGDGDGADADADTGGAWGSGGDGNAGSGGDAVVGDAWGDGGGDAGGAGGTWGSAPVAVDAW